MALGGLVYILTNPSFRDGIVKIGMTTRTAEDRAYEIYVGSTGVPEQFKIAFTEQCADCALAEARVHESLRQYRVNDRREFFNVSLDEAIAKIKNEVEKVNAASKADVRLSPVYSVKIIENSSERGDESSEAKLESPMSVIESSRTLPDTDGSTMLGSEKVIYKPLPRRVPWTSIFFGVAGALNLLIALSTLPEVNRVTFLFGALAVFPLMMAFAHRND